MRISGCAGVYVPVCLQMCVRADVSTYVRVSLCVYECVRMCVPCHVSAD